MAKDKAVITTVLLLLCLAPSIATLQPVKAQYQGLITINEDGTVSPLSAPILQNGNSYTLVSDETRTITINKSSITFNGNGHTINQAASTQNQGNAYGIHLNHVNNVTVTNTTIINTGNGIYAIQQPTAAIYLDYGGSNVIVGNNVLNNYNAMSLLESNNNIIIQNNFTNNNNPVGITSAVMLWGSSNNAFYQNNFINNNRPAGTASFDSESSGNRWDNGKEGNFWDNYNGTDTNGDGIGDTPYEIYTRNRSGALFPKNTDHYPLMTPFNATLYLLKTTPPRVLLLSPLNQTYNETNVPLTFTVDKALNSVTYSLDGKNNETIIANTTLSELANGNHTISIFVEDTFGNIGNQTINFTIAQPIPSEPFPTTIVAIVVLVALAIGLSVGFLFFRKRRAKTNSQATSP